MIDSFACCVLSGRPIGPIPFTFNPGRAAGAWPLAQKDEILTICPGSYHHDEIGTILDRGQPVCWYKVVAILPRLVEELRLRGRLEAAVLVEKVGRPDERIFHDLTQALHQDLSYFSLVLVR